MMLDFNRSIENTELIRSHILSALCISKEKLFESSKSDSNKLSYEKFEEKLENEKNQVFLSLDFVRNLKKYLNQNSKNGEKKKNILLNL